MTKPVFRFADSGSCAVLAGMPVTYKKGQAVLFTIMRRMVEPENTRNYFLRAQVQDRNGKKMGAYAYTIDTFNKQISNGLIVTEPKYERKGIGEIMRLSSIMELIENNLKAIVIASVPNAVPFHFLYNFMPRLKDKETALKILINIAHKSKIDEIDRKEAKKLLSEIPINETSDNLNAVQSKKINKFLYEYIKKYKNNWDNAKFPPNLPMILTRKQIQKFADFYNALFKKHGIDYTV